MKTLLPGIAGMEHEATGLGDRSTYDNDPKDQRRSFLHLRALNKPTHLDQTHSAVSSDGQSVMVTESRNLSSSDLLHIFRPKQTSVLGLKKFMTCSKEENVHKLESKRFLAGQ